MIDVRSDRVIAEVNVGIGAHCLALDPAGRYVYVTNQDSSVLNIIDAQTLRYRGIINLDAAPYGVVADATGNFVYAASNALSVIDVVKVTTGGSGNRGRRLRPPPVNAEVVDRIPVASGPKGLAISGDGRRLYATHFLSGEISVIDTSTRRVMQLISTGADSNMSQKIAIHPANGRAYLPHIRSNVTNPFLLFDTTVFPVVSVIDLATNAHVPQSRLDLSIGVASVNLPFDVAFSPDGSRLYSVNLGSEDVSVMDIAAQRRVAIIDVGNAPRGIAVTPDGLKGYVVNSLSDDVSVLDLQALQEKSRIKIQPGPLSPQLRRGKIVFFSSHSTDISLDRWMSCASCHFEGEIDGRTWHFTSGPRNTTSMRGVAGTLPLHWSADRDEVQDFEFTIRTLQAGTGLIKTRDPNPELGPPNAGLSTDLDALAAFVLSVQPKPSPFASSERGRAIFNRPDVGCTSCHPAPLYTDSTLSVRPFTLHDVGTGTSPEEQVGTAFDTPSLRGVWATAPYLHDGSAPTLRDVLTTNNPKDRHGKTSQLSATEIDDLVNFLLSL